MECKQIQYEGADCGTLFHSACNIDMFNSTYMLKKVQKSREYSKRFRAKQLNYTMQLEAKVKELEDEVAVAYSSIEFYGGQRAVFKMENSVIKRRIIEFSNELLSKQGQTQELKNEINILKNGAPEMQQIMYAENNQSEFQGIMGFNPFNDWNLNF